MYIPHCMDFLTLFSYRAPGGFPVGELHSFFLYLRLCFPDLLSCFLKFRPRVGDYSSPCTGVARQDCAAFLAGPATIAADHVLACHVIAASAFANRTGTSKVRVVACSLAKGAFKGVLLHLSSPP